MYRLLQLQRSLPAIMGQKALAACERVEYA